MQYFNCDEESEVDLTKKKVAPIGDIDDFIFFGEDWEVSGK